jgi:hypothetical protein
MGEVGRRGRAGLCAALDFRSSVVCNWERWWRAGVRPDEDSLEYWITVLRDGRKTR